MKKSLDAHIYKIGRRLVKCKNNCDGVVHDLTKGILPRCLIFETGDRVSGKGCVIVGLNPGLSKPDEHHFYLSNGVNYKQVVTYWEKSIRNKKYYSLLRGFADQLGLKGPILWTELVKCETKVGRKLPPIETRRRCIRTYLNEELRLVPSNWPLIAVGREAYKALAYCFLDRIVVGIPHATGSFGHFSRLFDKNGHLVDKLRPSIDELWDNRMGKARWLDVRKRTARSR